MQYLRIKPTKAKTPDRARALVIKKTRKYGSVISETSISVKRPVLLVGAAGSGKSYWLSRLIKSCEMIWKGSTLLSIQASAPISAWVDNPGLIAWYEKEKGVEWSKVKSWTRLDALIDYVASHDKLILFIDDLHLLSGRKAKIITDCVKNNRVFIATTTDEGRISPSLRKVVLNSDPQIFRLNTDVAYDATPIFIWLMVLVALVGGWWEVAGIVGGLQAFSGGRRAAKQA